MNVSFVSGHFQRAVDSAAGGIHLDEKMPSYSQDAAALRAPFDFVGAFVRAFLLVGVLCVALQTPFAEEPSVICPAAGQGDRQTALLVMSTSEGEIVIELHENAAPEAVRTLVGLVRGLVIDPATEDSENQGHRLFDGLVFDHCKPHIEIRTSSLESEGSQPLPMELNAQALGLDTLKITDPAEAMAVLQNDLMAANQVAKRTGRTNKRLQGWMDEWYESHSAEFLVGASWEQVNQALGYVYEEGLESRPVTAGAVTLVPATPREASARLSITLTDMPARTGRWMVIGTVTEGLELAQAISKGPLTPEKSLKYRPLQPVVVEKIEVECRTRQGG